MAICQLDSISFLYTATPVLAPTMLDAPSGLNLDLLCVQELGTASFCKNFAKLYFDAKHLEKGLQNGHFGWYWKLAKFSKQKSTLLPWNLALVTSGELLIVFSTKVNLLYLLYSTGRRCCLLHLIKQNCLLKLFLWTLILMTRVSLCLFSLLELIWNCIILL